MNTRTVCRACGRQDTIIAVGSVQAWAEIRTTLGDDGKLVLQGLGRIEVDSQELFETDYYECSVCEESDLRFEKLAKVIHPWSPEWMEGGDGKTNKEAADAGPEQDT